MLIIILSLIIIFSDQRTCIVFKRNEVRLRKLQASKTSICTYKILHYCSSLQKFEKLVLTKTDTLIKVCMYSITHIQVFPYCVLCMPVAFFSLLILLPLLCLLSSSPPSTPWHIFASLYSLPLVTVSSTSRMVALQLSWLLQFGSHTDANTREVCQWRSLRRSPTPDLGSRKVWRARICYLWACFLMFSISCFDCVVLVVEVALPFWTIFSWQLFLVHLVLHNNWQLKILQSHLDN